MGLHFIGLVGFCFMYFFVQGRLRYLGVIFSFTSLIERGMYNLVYEGAYFLLFSSLMPNTKASFNSHCCVVIIISVGNGEESVSE